MAGTKEGGVKAADTNKKKYGKDFYASIGAKGGKRGKTGGFASNKKGADGLTGRERARLAGSKGGQISKRGKVLLETQEFNKEALEGFEAKPRFNN